LTRLLTRFIVGNLEQGIRAGLTLGSAPRTIPIVQDEQRDGFGEVFVQASRESLGTFKYWLSVGRRKGSLLWHIDAKIDLESSLAIKALSENLRLTLRIEDGRCVDFFVSGFSFTHGVSITATGPLDLRPSG